MSETDIEKVLRYSCLPSRSVNSLLSELSELMLCSSYSENKERIKDFFIKRGEGDLRKGLLLTDGIGRKSANQIMQWLGGTSEIDDPEWIECQARIVMGDKYLEEGWINHHFGTIAGWISE